ncbi:type II toxin-antitoxin system VapC family toxin [Tardiphaga sp.]|uniref:type II toxin-antitoxin system VapC family toxin n=1 Tax=Tardiphaga sp. TaxID=1926292 RepID=UPI0025D33641|nr:type II toxin-antitoxin system VapC family toxin [Tardiphaga sp.]
MNLYLDTSVVVSLIFSDDHSSKADSWYRETTPGPIISSFVKLEFAATISRYLRINRLSQAPAERLLDFFDRWAAEETHCIEISANDMTSAERMVRNFATKLSGPDAIHLAIAARLNVPLVTFDERLAAAAPMQTIEAVVPTDAL